MTESKKKLFNAHKEILISVIATLEHQRLVNRTELVDKRLTTQEHQRLFSAIGQLKAGLTHLDKMIEGEI